MREFARQIGQAEDRVTSPAIHDENIVTAGDFRIDLRSHQVLVRGQEVRLGETEFEMLMFLTGHHTNIITPHTRLATRWGREHVHQSDFLRLLADLQRKLEAVPGGARYIQTEPWLVCRFHPGSSADQ
jgi:two-component system, OmpR family, KDP operon response regulator KdpE